LLANGVLVGTKIDTNGKRRKVEHVGVDLL